MNKTITKAVRVDVPPNNGELLLSYWRRIGGQFDGGFLEAARQAAEKHGFYYERAHVYNCLQMEFPSYVKMEVNSSIQRLNEIQSELKGW